MQIQNKECFPTKLSNILIETAKLLYLFMMYMTIHQILGKLDSSSLY
jgi:hypothetical protein